MAVEARWPPLRWTSDRPVSGFRYAPELAAMTRVTGALAQVLACLPHRDARPAGGGADVGDRREQVVLPEVVGLPPGDLIEQRYCPAGAGRQGRLPAGRGQRRGASPSSRRRRAVAVSSGAGRFLAGMSRRYGRTARRRGRADGCPRVTDCMTSLNRHSAWRSRRQRDLAGLRHTGRSVLIVHLGLRGRAWHITGRYARECRGTGQGARRGVPRRVRSAWAVIWVTRFAAGSTALMRSVPSPAQIKAMSGSPA